MKTLILTSAIILISVVSLFAQSARPGNPIGGIIVKGGLTSEAAMPGQPIKGVIVKGGQNPTALVTEMPCQPIGGIVVKGGLTAENTVNNPLYEQDGHTAENPMFKDDMGSAGTNTNPYFKDNNLAGETQNLTAGSPIGGIVVKGGSNKPTALTQNPLYTGSGTQGSNPLYKGN